MTHDLWRIEEGEGPVIGTAIHAGHSVREDLEQHMEIDESHRLREEDPFTYAAIASVPTRIRVKRSRFEVDLNRDEDHAVYETPDDAWGLRIWDQAGLSAEEKAHSLAIHERYYDMLEALLKRVQKEHGDFVLLDVHSYNHRRDGPNASPTPAEQAPEVNIGTISMDRERWAHVVEPFMACLAAQNFRGRRLDVRENVAFQGRGEQTRFVHEQFPEHGCAIAIEFKKFYMDEWSGWPDFADLRAMRNLIRETLPVLETALDHA